MAVNAYLRICEMDPDPTQVLKPIAVRMIDSQAINTKQFDRIDTGLV